MSSRNVYLSPEHRAKAPVLNRGLRKLVDAYSRGERSVEALVALARDEVATKEGDGVSLEYLRVSDIDSLEDVTATIPKHGALVSAVLRCGKTRLLDNVILPASV